MKAEKYRKFVMGGIVDLLRKEEQEHGGQSMP